MRLVSGAGPIFVFAVFMTACADDPAATMNCPDIVRPAVRLVALDSVTGKSVGDAYGWLLSDEHEERLQTVGDRYAGGFGRAGSYFVVLSHADYVPWLHHVHVRGDRCGPWTVDLTARLRPSASGPSALRAPDP
jgi:hypothetical protein